MDIHTWRRRHRGPFSAHQLHDGCGYELTNGHPILCPPPNSSRAALRLAASQVLNADPAVHWAATGLGFSPDSTTLRSLDVMVWVRGRGTPEPPLLPERDRLRQATALMLATDPAADWTATAAELTPGPRMPAPATAEAASDGEDWIREAPPLAVEIADEQADEGDLEQKIQDLIEGGVQIVWVARREGPRRVEVHAQGQPIRKISTEHELTAPGILSLPLPALALLDRDAALDQLRLRLEMRRGGRS